jgi:hypothetical protein
MLRRILEPIARAPGTALVLSAARSSKRCFGNSEQ